MTRRFAPLFVLAPLAVVAALEAGRQPQRPPESDPDPALQRVPPSDGIAAAMARTAEKDALAANLLAGRAALAAVAARFGELNRAMPGHLEFLRKYYAGRSDEECHAINVIEFALTRVSDPAAREAARARLVAEFRGLFPAAEVPPRLGPPPARRRVDRRGGAPRAVK